MREKYKDYSAYKWINVGEFRILKDFVERIDKNATSTEGLERLLSFIEENPKLEESVHLFENNNRFLREYASDFCRMVEYIQNPDLVIPRDLMDERRLIIEQIKNGKREEAIKCFENFFEKFISLYTQEHKKFYSNKIFDEIKRIRKGPWYNLLLKLSKIESISVPDDIVKVENRMEAIPKRCERDPRRDLVLRPGCECGYYIGKELKSETGKELKEFIMSGINEYLSAVKERKEELANYLTGLKTLGRKEESRELEQLLRVNEGTDLRWIVDEGVVKNINLAFRKKLLVVDRSLKELTDSMEGRKFQRNEILKIVEKWIGEVDDETFINVVLPKKGNTAILNLAESEEAFWVTYSLIKHKMAKESLFLRTHYRMDLGLLDEIERLGDELLPVEVRLEEDKLEELIQEFKLNDRPVSQLISIIENEKIFTEISREAGKEVIRRLSANPGLSIPATFRDPRGYIDTIIDFQDIQNGISTPLEEDPVLNYTKWLSSFSFLSEKIATENFNLEIIPSILMKKLKRDVKKKIFENEEKFKETKGGLKIDDFRGKILNVYRKKYKKIFILLFDAMRWDLWEYFTPAIKTILKSHRMTDLVSLIAREPTVTEINRKALLGDMEIYSPEMVRGLEEREIIPVNFDFIDKRIHNLKLDLYPFYEELLCVMKEEVKKVTDFIHGSLIFILSDHGFLYKDGNYTHGGGSLFERIIPLSVWLPK